MFSKLALFLISFYQLFSFAQAAQAVSPVTALPDAGLQSVQSTAKFHVLRMKPGQDFLIEITEWAKRNKIKAASIVTVVGSFKKVNLRYANLDSTTAQNGFFEIVSLVGTFNESSAHLHASVSNSKGETFGGHLVNGNIVYTTAEVVIAEIENAVFTREHDAASGWDELVIRPKR